MIEKAYDDYRVKFRKIPLKLLLLLLFLAYGSMHVSHDRPCSIDLSDSTDIITVDRSHIGMINLKISAQTDKLFWRYSHRKYGLSVPFRMLHRKTAISKFAFSQQ